MAPGRPEGGGAGGARARSGHGAGPAALGLAAARQARLVPGVLARSALSLTGARGPGSRHWAGSNPSQKVLERSRPGFSAEPDEATSHFEKNVKATEALRDSSREGTSPLGRCLLG